MHRDLLNERLPKAALSRHIECFWRITFSGIAIPSSSLLPPQGTFDLIFTPTGVTFNHYTGDQIKNVALSPGVWLVGQQMRGYCWQGQKGEQLFGIRFKPFGLFPCRNIMPYELANGLVKLNEAHAINTNSINEVLTCLFASNATLFEQQCFAAESFVEKLFANCFDFPQSVRETSNNIMRRRGDIRLKELCGNFGISRVTIRNKYLQSIGILPKELCKIWRLNYFFLLKSFHPNARLTELSLMAGYYDQAHFTREFKSTFSQSPLKFFQLPHGQLENTAHQIASRFHGVYFPQHTSFKPV